MFSLERSTYSVVEDSGGVRVGVARREGAWGYNLTLNVVPVSGITNMTISEFMYVRTYSTHISTYWMHVCCQNTYVYVVDVYAHSLRYDFECVCTFAIHINMPKGNSKKYIYM